MDSTWFLKVIEESSLDSDVQLLPWNDSLFLTKDGISSSESSNSDTNSPVIEYTQETQNACDDNEETLAHTGPDDYDSKNVQGQENYDDLTVTPKECSVGCHDVSESVEILNQNSSGISGNDGNYVVDSPAEDDYAESSSTEGVEFADSDMEEINDVTQSDNNSIRDDEEGIEEEEIMVGDCDGETDDQSTGSEHESEEGNNTFKQKDKDPIAEHLHSGKDHFGYDIDEDGVKGNPKSLDEFVQGLNRKILNNISFVDDGSLLDFADELGEDSDSETSEAPFNNSISSGKSQSSEGSAGSASSQQTLTLKHSLQSGENNVTPQRTSDIGPFQRTSSMRPNRRLSSTSSSNSERSHTSIKQRCHVGLTLSKDPVSIHSQQSSTVSNSSPASISSRSQPSKLSRTSLNRIPVTRKPSIKIKRWISGNIPASFNRESLTVPENTNSMLPQVITSTYGPGVGGIMDVAEPLPCWLPPIAFTEDEDSENRDAASSPQRPVNETVEALKEFARLRRRVSDEYEVAEQVSLRRKKVSDEAGIPQQPLVEEKIEKMRKKRLKVIGEILKTEQTYQHHLDMILKVVENMPCVLLCTVFSTCFLTV